MHILMQSGYRVSFLPLCMNTHAPTPPGSPRRKGDAVYTEAIYVSTIYWGPTPKRPSRSTGEYLVHWCVLISLHACNSVAITEGAGDGRYVGQIPEDAVPEADTGMADEKNYESHLVEREQAYELLGGFEGAIVKRAFDLWDETRKIKKYYAERRERGKRDSEWSEVNVEWQAQGQSSAANEEQRQR